MNRKNRQPTPGQPKPPLTKLKELPPTERDTLMEILRAKTYLEASPEIGERVGFPCSPKVLLRFYHWQETQESLENSDDLLDQITAFEKESHPNWPFEKARVMATIFFLRHTMQKKDLKAFASMARLSLQNERLELLKSKFEESQRTKLETALEALADKFKKNPEAVRLYREARKLVDPGNEHTNTH